MARKADAKCDGVRRGLGRRSDGELASLLARAVQKECAWADGCHTHHRPKLMHPAAILPALQQLERIGVREKLLDVPLRFAALKSWQQGTEHLLRRRMREVA